MIRHLLDLGRYRRGVQLGTGQALFGRLLTSADVLGVPLRTSSRAASLLVEYGVVTGALVGSLTGDVTIWARATVLAAGGHPHDIECRRAAFPRTPNCREHRSLARRSALGDELRLGEAGGGEVDTSLAAAGAWCPVSTWPGSPAPSLGSLA